MIKKKDFKLIKKFYENGYTIWHFKIPKIMYDKKGKFLGNIIGVVSPYSLTLKQVREHAYQEYLSKVK